MNETGPVTFFIIEGMKDKYMILFVIFLTVYVLVLGGNSMIIYLVRTDPKLNSPMYFFLHNLSFSDMVYTSVTIPNMLSGFLIEVKTISTTGCFVQMYVFLSMAVTGRALLTAMAYDRYVAICDPLRYTSILTRHIRRALILSAWGFGWLITLPSVVLAVRLPYCGPNRVQHNFCDHSSVVRLACVDTRMNSIVALTLALIAILGTFALILASYVCISKSVCRMGSAERLKAFTTCVSHLTVVCISYVSALCVYISYRVATFDPDVRLIVAVLYSVLTPLLNPIIYTLRNKELQEAVRRAFCRCGAVAHTAKKTVPAIC